MNLRFRVFKNRRNLFVVVDTKIGEKVAGPYCYKDMAEHICGQKNGVIPIR